MQQQYTGIYEKRGRWVVAYVEEIPGVNPQGRTLREARANLRDALRMVLEANRQIAARLAVAGARREPLRVEVPA